jgi:tetratricopeptide (TPR) repeat protein
LKPVPIEAFVYLANFFTDTGQVERGVPLLRDALKTSPNHPEVHWELGYAYRFAGMLQESVAEAERARELDPGVKLNSSALNSYLYVTRYDNFLKSLPAGGESPLILFYRDFGEYHKSNWAAAKLLFDQAFEARPSLMQARVGKALRYKIMQELERGLAILGRPKPPVSRRGVGDSEGLYKLAQAYAQLGDTPSAMRVLRGSIDGGFFPYPYLNADPLQSLRGEQEGKVLLGHAQARHDGFRKLFF